MTSLAQLQTQDNSPVLIRAELKRQNQNFSVDFQPEEGHSGCSASVFLPRFESGWSGKTSSCCIVVGSSLASQGETFSVNVPGEVFGLGQSNVLYDAVPTQCRDAQQPAKGV